MLTETLGVSPIDGSRGEAIVNHRDRLANAVLAKASGFGFSGTYGATVHGLAFLIELVALNGRNQLMDENMYSVLKY